MTADRDPVVEARELLAAVRAVEESAGRKSDGPTWRTYPDDPSDVQGWDGSEWVPLFRGDGCYNETDAALIAAAPRLLAALADEVERLRGVAEAARALLPYVGELWNEPPTDEDEDEGYDDHFVPCPQASLSEDARDELTLWLDGRWRALRRVLLGAGYEPEPPDEGAS